MTVPNRSSGIAIVSVVLILAAIMVMGVGSMFLTQMNLGISQNVRATTTAANNATTGINAAFAALHKYYEENGALPTTLQIPTVSGQDYQTDYTLSSYSVSGTAAHISVVGRGANEAEYVAEALVQFVGGARLPRYFAYGLASEDVVTASGNAAYVNAGIHGNKGFSLSGNQYFYVCTRRNSSGDCTREERVPSDSVPMSASPGATTCRVSGNPGNYPVCSRGVPVTLIDPVEIEPDASTRLETALGQVSRGAQYSSVLGVSCDRIYSSAPSGSDFRSAVSGMSNGSTVCIESGSLNISGNWSMSDVNIVTRNHVSFSGNWSASNMTIISTTGNVTGSGNAPLTSLRVFAGGDIRFSGNHNITGRNTYAAGGDLSISGNAAAVTSASGDPAIGVALVADGDITISGNSRLVVAAVAGGTFGKSGNADLIGRVASKGALTVSGNFHLDGGLEIDNVDLIEAGSPTLRVLSVR